jgi:hypothetical protein
LPKPSLEEFISSDERNAWIVFERFLACYVRKSPRIICGLRVECLDIANTNVHYKNQRKGLYKRFLALTEAIAAEKGWVLFHESVLNPDLLTFLKSRGYLDVPHANPPSLYKIIA